MSLETPEVVSVETPTIDNKDILTIDISSCAFSADSPEIRLATLLWNLMVENNPKTRIPKNLAAWCRDLNRLIRLDKHTEEEIRQVILFSQKDPFWQTNILSAHALREQYDRLYLKARNDHEKKKHAAEKEKLSGIEGLKVEY